MDSLQRVSWIVFKPSQLRFHSPNRTAPFTPPAHFGYHVSAYFNRWCSCFSNFCIPVSHNNENISFRHLHYQFLQLSMKLLHIFFICCKSWRVSAGWCCSVDALCSSLKLTYYWLGCITTLTLPSSDCKSLPLHAFYRFCDKKRTLCNRQIATALNQSIEVFLSPKFQFLYSPSLFITTILPRFICLFVY